MRRPFLASHFKRTSMSSTSLFAFRILSGRVDSAKNDHLLIFVRTRTEGATTGTEIGGFSDTLAKYTRAKNPLTWGLVNTSGSVIGRDVEDRNCIWVGQSQLLIRAATKKLNCDTLLPTHEDKLVARGQSESGMGLEEKVSGLGWVCIDDDIHVLCQISWRNYSRCNKM